MPIEITELGGLTSGETHLAIALSEGRLGAAMEVKLKEHREQLEVRLTAQDEQLRLTADGVQAVKLDVAALVGTRNVPGMIPQLVDKIDTLVDNHQLWHGDDLTFRADLVKRVSSMEEAQAQLSTQMGVLRWVVAASSASLKALSFAVKVLSTGDVWRWAGIAFVVWILHFFSPFAAKWLQQIIGK